MFKNRLWLLSGCNVQLIVYIILDALNFSKGITTTHYDKPPLQKSITVPTEFANLTVTERQKRLLPYINFYVTQNLQPQRDDYYVTEDHYPITDANKEEVRPSSQNKFSELLQTTYQPTQVYQTETSQQAKTKFTPFLDTNALPGPFTPMIPQITKVKVTYTPVDHKENVPNYSAIYDKLPQIKMQHSIIESPSAYDTPKTVIQFFQRKPHVRYIPVPELHEPRTHPKTYVHTYTPTSIDLPIQEHNYHQQINNQNHLIHQNINKPLIAKATPQPIRIIQLHNPKHNLVTPNMQRKPKPTYVPLLTVNPQNQFIVQEQKQYHNQNHKQYLQEVIPSSKPLVLFTQKEYPSLLSHNEIKQTKPYVLLQPSNTYTTESSTNYQHAPSLHLENSVTDIPIQNHEDPNSLNTILKKLQDSNALPHTLTEDNIDNSIKTLINILHSFKKGQRFSGPIVVEDLNEEHATGTDSDSPGSVTQMFPANTPEGGTPGRPGIDYPALSRIPQTNFDCQTQRYKGFFADPDTNCQVWHYCDLNGGQASFLCPNGTIFSQVALTCDWWFNVKCSTTTQLYVLNERLYKYIIPLKPKFPEDYAGPLVDRYLALKFQEMEEKLKKEKKEKEKDKSEEIDELQLLEDQNQVSTSHTPEPQTSHK